MCTSETPDVMHACGLVPRKKHILVYNFRQVLGLNTKEYAVYINMKVVSKSILVTRVLI